MHSSVEHVHGPEEMEYGPDELVVVSLVREGEHYVRDFVDHHLSMGAKHVVFLDNGSTDETVSTARSLDNVTVLRTELPYKKYALLMKQYLIRRFGKGRWILCNDVDELFDYPYSDRVSLRSFLAYLNENSYTAVVAQMLDMFPEGPLSEEDKNVSLKERHRFYDLTNLREEAYDSFWREGNAVSNEEIKILRGGIRKTVFGTNPYVTKHPLVFVDEEIEPLANFAHRVRNARVADVSCVLYHYKFVEGFREHAERAVREGNYWHGSAAYKRYLGVLEETPGLRIKQSTSRELSNVNELVDGGFLLVSEAYLDRVAGEEKEAARALESEPRRLVEALLEAARREKERSFKAKQTALQLRERERELRELKMRMRERRQDGSSEREERLARRTRRLERQLEEIKSSRTWRVMVKMGNLKRWLFRGG
jgi:hypothetical protein